MLIKPRNNVLPSVCQEPLGFSVFPCDRCFRVSIQWNIEGFAIYFIVTTGAGVALNFLAWKKNSRGLAAAAGVSYLLGLVTIISGIICFVCPMKKQKKEEQKEIMPEKAAEIKELN